MATFPLPPWVSGSRFKAKTIDIPSPNDPTSPQHDLTGGSSGSGTTYDPTDPLGQYFASHPSAGDAWAQLKATLDQYGLSSLYNFVENGIIQGWDAAQAVQHLRETPEYKQRFAGNAVRTAAGLTPLSETDYLNTERGYAQLAKQYGVPTGFYDQPSDFANLIGNDVSVNEYGDRLQNGYQVATMSDAPTKAALKSYYGLSDGDLAAYFLDPTRTEAILMKQLASAQLGGSAARTGWGDLAQSNAEQLATLGVTQSQADQGFSKLAQANQLMSALPGSTESNISQQQQIGAQFAQNAASQQAIAARAQQRISPFAGGGSFTTNKEGVAGVGIANQQGSGI